MCEFLSAVKGKTKTGRDKWYFLTHALIHGTPRGELLQQKYGGDDLIGHSAIREFFHLRSGDNWECTDFSTPANFPPIIVKAIKDGEFKGFGTPPRLLSGPAGAEYEKSRQAAWAEYRKVQQAASAEYEKVQQPAWAEYRKVQQAASAEYEKVRQAAVAECEKVQQPAWAEYEEVRQAAWAEYEKSRQAAVAEYGKSRQAAFWNLFANPENRAEGWR